MKAFLDHYRAVILLAILSFAFFTRMFNLNNPEVYMFDEVYHAVTAKLIAQNDPRAYEWWNPAPEPDTAVDWLHPPLAKYFQATSILAFGENSFGWRFSSVIFGVLVILITYHLAYRLFKNSAIALLSAAIASLDGLLLTQSRIAMNDIHVTFFILFTLYNYQVYLQTKKHSKLFLTGCAAGLALASKWSGLFGLSIILFFEFWNCLKYFLIDHRDKYITNMTKEYGQIIKDLIRWLGIRLLFLVIIPITIYVASYGHMFIQGKGWAHFRELHNQIWWYQTHLEATHPYQSRPIEWFLNIRPVWMYVSYLPNNYRADIYAFGNPIIFWIGAIFVLFSLLYIFFYCYTTLKINKQLHRTQSLLKSAEQTITALITNPLLFLLISYFLVWAPWQFSPRIMFFYHYAPAVPLLCILISYWLYLSTKYTKLLLISVLFCMFIVFCVWYPHWVAIPVPSKYAEAIYFALPQWQ